MKKLLLLTLCLSFMPGLSHAGDLHSDDLHSVVVRTVSEDHAREVKAGRFDRKQASIEKKSPSMRRESHHATASKKIEKTPRHERK